jgi:phosphomannomutase
MALVRDLTLPQRALRICYPPTVSTFLLTARDVPTPTVAYAIADQNLAGALIVTASHNPPEYNGVKFVPENTASPLPSVTDAIESNLKLPVFFPKTERGSIRCRHT